MSERTRAIIVTHLFGNPCDMDRNHGTGPVADIPVIEDCAQAFLAAYGGRYVGTIGAIGCFSLQQGKHMTTGEGGVVSTRTTRSPGACSSSSTRPGATATPTRPLFPRPELSHERTAGRRGRGPTAKARGRGRGAHRNGRAARPGSLTGLPGIQPPWSTRTSPHVSGNTALRVDGNVIDGGARALGRLLKEEGHRLGPALHPEARLHVRGLPEAADLRQQPVSRSLSPGRRRSTTARTHFPGTFDALEVCWFFPWNERYTEEHVDYIAGCHHEAAAAAGEVQDNQWQRKLQFGIVGAGAIAQAYVRRSKTAPWPDWRPWRTPAGGRRGPGRGRLPELRLISKRWRRGPSMPSSSAPRRRPIRRSASISWTRNPRPVRKTA